MSTAPLLPLAPEQTYARDLDGLYTPWQGAALTEPQVLRLNRALAAELGLDADALDSAAGALLLSGAMPPEQGTPLAMAYAGHQFGGFSPLLGDGRALLLGEVVDTAGRRRDVHLKGSGRTPFSRGGDGRAALGPVLREFLMGEAMHALGIPTTRALAAVTTGESVQREEPEIGAVLARVAASHLRVGTLQLFASRGQTEDVRRVADHAIARHDPDLLDVPAETGERYVAFLTRVRDRQAALVASWMAVGFVHGVLNTDNVTLSGETIDYGPCAFVDAYDPAAVFSSIDTGGRYAFGQQPGITQWNLARLAEALLPLLVPEEQRSDQDAQVAAAVTVLDGFPAAYASAWTERMRAKLGLTPEKDQDDQALATGLHEIMRVQGLDLTRTFRSLSSVVRGDLEALRAECTDLAAVDAWLDAYAARTARETGSAEQRAAAMDAVNPVYVPRNHLVDEAIIAARGGDMSLFDQLLEVLADPFVERPGLEAYAQPAPDSFGPFVTFCGT